MTLSSTTSKHVYTGNGSQVEFPVVFAFLANADISATHTDTSGIETAWIEDVHYALTGSGSDSGGTLTVITAPTDYTPADGTTLTIRRIPKVTQETDLPLGGNLDSTVIETALDHGVMIDQSLAEELDRAVKVPVEEVGAGNLPRNADRKSKRAGWDSSGAWTALTATNDSANTATAAGGTTSRSHAERFGDVINVKDFGATGDGVTNDSAAVQAAIDAAAASTNGCTVLFPSGTYKMEVTLAAKVQLRGDGDARVILKNVSSGTIIDTPTALTDWVGLSGFEIIGDGTEAVPLIYFRNVNKGHFRDSRINVAGRHGFQWDDGAAADVRRIALVNCVQNTSGLAEEAGAFEIGAAATDGYIEAVQAGCGLTVGETVTSANLYACGVVVRGSTHTFSMVNGEFSDVGIFVASGAIENRWQSCRADRNAGHGFVCESGSQYFDLPLCQDNGHATNNTYSDFKNSGGNVAVNGLRCRTDQTNKPKYNIEDTHTGDFGKPIYYHPILSGAQTAAISTAGIDGAAVIFPDGPALELPTADATPSIYGCGVWEIANSSPQTITDFDDGVEGQRILIYAENNTTTVQNNANIKTLTGADMALLTGSSYEWRFRYGVWWPIGSSVVGTVTFADADATPSVAGGGRLFKTANTGATTITDFNDGVDGQEVAVIIGDANTTVDFTGTSLKGNAGVDWTPASGDHMVCTYDGTNWYCAVSDNTA